MTFSIRSPAFDNGAPIPVKFTGEGDNTSPPLEWSDPPAGTRSFTLLVVDPDAPRGVFKHWALYNVDATRTSLPGAVVPDKKWGQGINDAGHSFYDGPYPPRGHGLHHYHFRLLALNVERLTLSATATVDDVRAAATPHILGEATTIGTFSRA